MTKRAIPLAILVAACVAGFVNPSPAHSATQNTAGPPWTAQAAVPSSYRMKFDSGINGETYTLFIRVPVTPPPPQGYPVIYVLDGDFNFGTAANVALTLNNDPAHAPVVVAIGHGLLSDMEVVRRYAVRAPGDHSPMGVGDIVGVDNMLRLHDYTLPVAPNHLAPVWTGLTAGNIGGLDKFLKVIETEIKPKVAQLIPINTANEALFGHSVGGLAVLRALFTEPGAFRTFIAASPSIWWDADAVLADEARFAKVIETRAAAPRVLITVGADEPDSPNPPPAFIASLPADKATELTAYVKMASQWSGMITGARDLVARLGKIQGGPDYKVSFVEFAGENHASVTPAALNRGMWFAFGP